MTAKQRIAQIDELIRRLLAERTQLQIGIDYPALDSHTIEGMAVDRSGRHSIDCDRFAGHR